MSSIKMNKYRHYETLRHNKPEIGVNHRVDSRNIDSDTIGSQQWYTPSLKARHSVTP